MGFEGFFIFCKGFMGFLLLVYGEWWIGSDFARRCWGMHDVGFEFKSDERGILLWEFFREI